MPRSHKPVEKRTRRRPPRVEALASLPLFFRLDGRKVVLAGGTEAAGWKAELLAASGASVHIFAEELDEGFAALLEKGGAGGTFIHHRQPWSATSFEGATLAIADAGSEGEAQAFYCAARAAGVPVNVIDTPRFCEFQFGSIVNRSPVVIGISTNGVAPILGQAIRRRIEALLPRSLQAWAAFAGLVRGRVLETLKAGAERRRFWERFTDLAFSGKTAPKDPLGCDVGSLFQEAAETGRGRVSVVGTGDGDAELLTLKAVRALQSADVIFFDACVEDDVLELARREAKRVVIKKQLGAPRGQDAKIIEDMSALVEDGKHVVLLKSGNLSATRELRVLLARGLSVSQIPGVERGLAEFAPFSSFATGKPETTATLLHHLSPPSVKRPVREESARR
ncbi:SAM-dependent methyltransferase [Labrenzia sp. VG12]|uniref:SAM-dependent methyltransferase n=1 Tax=Labrenzia sp. VG12 TaxID=2021862 RepID=UPI000B8BDF1F|nr:SAM-dependent methyltransferase [Labrenzia sp. VG12]ASP36499.1 siroheme synthase [Labrenzia sp. VG12]